MADPPSENQHGDAMRRIPLCILPPARSRVILMLGGA
jgi:hypothetical protein